MKNTTTLENVIETVYLDSENHYDEFIPVRDMEAESLNRMTHLAGPRGSLIRYAHDAMGNVTNVVYPDSSQWNATRGSHGKTVRVTNRRSRSTDLTRNNDDLITERRYQDGTTAVYEYNTLGHAVMASNTHGRVDYEWDARERLTRVTYPSGHWVSFTYDANGRRTRLQCDSGFELNYAYDASRGDQRVQSRSGRRPGLRHVARGHPGHPPGFCVN